MRPHSQSSWSSTQESSWTTPSYHSETNSSGSEGSEAREAATWGADRQSRNAVWEQRAGEETGSWQASAWSTPSTETGGHQTRQWESESKAREDSRWSAASSKSSWDDTKQWESANKSAEDTADWRGSVADHADAPPPRKRRFCNFSPPLPEPGAASRVVDLVDPRNVAADAGSRSGGASSSGEPRTMAMGPANPKYKSGLCWYRAGNCKWGDLCFFAHAEDELRSPSQENGRWIRVHKNYDDEKAGDTSGGYWQDEFCPFYQTGCCWFEGNGCPYQHKKAPKDSGYRTALCREFFHQGTCSRTDCFYAHGVHELRTPDVFKGVHGYKAALCSFYMMEGLECMEETCMDAHGYLDLRRLPLSAPRSLTMPFSYSDAHVHLDILMRSRRYGTSWFWKRSACRYKATCWNPGGCMFYHDASDKYTTLQLDLKDLETLAEELAGVPNGTFEGCVHSCCDAEDLEDSLKIIELSKKALGGKVYAAFGIHPTSFEQYTPEVEARIEAAFDACGSQAVAWGECGLDYYRRLQDIEMDPSVRDAMRQAFRSQARAAVRRKLPLVVHSRDAEEDTLQILRELVPKDHPVYLHSFQGSIDMMTQFLHEWPRSCVGIAGCITYPAALNLVELVQALPLERMLLETDGPYMAPEPHRGEESHPGHIPWIADGVARAKGIPTHQVLAVTHQNFRRFYGV